MRLALDTNILAYVEGVNGDSQKKIAAELIQCLPEASTFLPVQVLGELFNVLVKKARWSRAQARAAILSWQDTFPMIETSPSVLSSAIDLAVQHKLRVWDAVILAAAEEAQCLLLLSEDLQDGFNWRGVTVANPFGKRRNELLAGLL
jgi:predicted nucleic acid-binding protein